MDFGPVLDNDLKTPQKEPMKIFFFAYVSDEKIVMRKKNEKGGKKCISFSEFKNIFRVYVSDDCKTKYFSHFFNLIHLKKMFTLHIFFFVLKSSETYAKFFLSSALFERAGCLLCSSLTRDNP